MNFMIRNGALSIFKEYLRVFNYENVWINALNLSHELTLILLKLGTSKDVDVMIDKCSAACAPSNDRDIKSIEH